MSVLWRAVQRLVSTGFFGYHQQSAYSVGDMQAGEQSQVSDLDVQHRCNSAPFLPPKKRLILWCEGLRNAIFLGRYPDIIAGSALEMPRALSRRLVKVRHNETPAKQPAFNNGQVLVKGNVISDLDQLIPPPTSNLLASDEGSGSKRGDVNEKCKVSKKKKKKKTSRTWHHWLEPGLDETDKTWL